MGQLDGCKSEMFMIRKLSFFVRKLKIKRLKISLMTFTSG